MKFEQITKVTEPLVDGVRLVGALAIGLPLGVIAGASAAFIAKRSNIYGQTSVAQSGPEYAGLQQPTANPDQLV